MRLAASAACQVLVVDEDVEQFVLDLDGGQPFGHGAFGFADHAGDQVALPADLVADFLHALDGDHAGHLLGRAEVDAS